MSKWVYTFGNGKAEGDANMRNLLGGKGANLAEMNKVGLPVPPGFTVTTEVCTYYYANNKKYRYLVNICIFLCTIQNYKLCCCNSN